MTMQLSVSIYQCFCYLKSELIYKSWLKFRWILYRWRTL